MNYQTKDSGKREQFDSGMVRDTQDGKARFDLLFPIGVPYHEQMLTRAANLMERGMAKYGERNWEKANSQEELDRAKASAVRHLMQWLNGEDDEDHAAAVIFNLIAAETIVYKLARKSLPRKFSSENLLCKVDGCGGLPSDSKHRTVDECSDVWGAPCKYPKVHHAFE